VAGRGLPGTDAEPETETCRMKHIAILGLDNFGRDALNELLRLNANVLVIDKNKELIDNFRDSEVDAVVLNLVNPENLKKVLPESIDGVIIDMGKSLEVSILATSYCSKMNVPMVIAVAETVEHGEILSLVGATNVIFPNIEAARRVARQIMSKSFLNYMIVNDSLAIGELAIPEFLIGKRLIDSRLREIYQLNLLFVRRGDEDFAQCGAGYVFREGDIGLFAGSNEALSKFSSDKDKKESACLLKNMFKMFRHSGG